MVEALHNLVDSGQVQSGATLYLETVPMLFLRDVPLIEGVWLDRYAIELAEWGALLKAKGYKLQEIEDAHRLALDWFVQSDGKEAVQVEIQTLHHRAACSLTKFHGRIDLKSILRDTGTATSQQIAYLVDMAKAEALDRLGEKQTAITLAERHLS
jgi:hypothetical protein